MGTPQRNKKNYSMASQPIELAIRNEPESYLIEIDGKFLDFKKFKLCSDRKQDIGWAFVKAIWRKRNDISASTAVAHRCSIVRFYEFLREHKRATRVAHIKQQIVDDFIFWLNAVLRKSDKQPLSETSKRKTWGHIREHLNTFMEDDSYGLDLELPEQVFDSKEGISFKPYSEYELSQIARASFADSRKAINGALNTELFYSRSPYIGQLIPHAIQISIKTGINPEVLFNLDIPSKSVMHSEMLNSSRLILPVKARSGKSQNIAMNDEVVDGLRVRNNVVRLLEEVGKLTEETRRLLPSDSALKNKLWLVKTYDGKVTVFNNCSYYMSLQAFSKKHDIKSDKNERLVINFRRFRPTFSEQILKLNGGNLRDLQKRLGHSNLRTTMSYLDPNLAERKKAFNYAGQAMERWAFQGNSGSPVEVANQLDISIENAEKLIDGEFNTNVGKCKNPLDSPLKGIKKGEVCHQYTECLRCPHCVVLKEDSNRLFSFYHWLMFKRETLGLETWEKNYSWIINNIDTVIAPALGDAEWIEMAKNEAKKNPFPIWRLDQQ